MTFCRLFDKFPMEWLRPWLPKRRGSLQRQYWQKVTGNLCHWWCQIFRIGCCNHKPCHQWWQIFYIGWRNHIPFHKDAKMRRLCRYTYLIYKSWVFEAYLITNTSIHFRWKIFNRWKGARRDKSTFFESSKQINLIDDVWDDWWNWIEDLIQSFLLTLKMIFLLTLKIIFPTPAENDYSFPCWK